MQCGVLRPVWGGARLGCGGSGAGLVWRLECVGLGPTRGAREAVRRAATHGWVATVTETVPARKRVWLRRERRRAMSKDLGCPVSSEVADQDPIMRALMQTSRSVARDQLSSDQQQHGLCGPLSGSAVGALDRESLWKRWMQYETLPYVCPYREWVRSQLLRHCGESRHALVIVGGTKYRVVVGDQICVPRIRAQVGSTVLLCKVLECGSPSLTLVGQPVVRYGRVEARVESHLRTAKVITVRKKPRNRRTKRHGWRHPVTLLEIRGIQIDYFERGSWEDTVRGGSGSRVVEDCVGVSYPRFTGVASKLAEADRSVQGRNQNASRAELKRGRKQVRDFEVPTPAVAHTRVGDLVPRVSAIVPPLNLETIQHLAFTSRPEYPTLPLDPLETGSGPLLSGNRRFTSSVVESPYTAHALRREKGEEPSPGSGITDDGSG